MISTQNRNTIRITVLNMSITLDWNAKEAAKEITLKKVSKILKCYNTNFQTVFAELKHET